MAPPQVHHAGPPQTFGTPQQVFTYSYPLIMGL